MFKLTFASEIVIDNNSLFPSAEAWAAAYEVFVVPEFVEATLTGAEMLGAGNIRIGGPEIFLQ